MNSDKHDHSANNRLDASRVPTSFRNPDYHFEVSSRFIAPDIDIMAYLKIHYMYLEMKQIDSVFGNAVYPSRFYGGRPYKLEHSLTDKHIYQLNNQGKGVTFTLTNHYFSDTVYQANRHFLQKHHRKGNGIVCTNDDLAQRIRIDFPDYILNASLIKNLDTIEKVRSALNIYDQVVIPMDKNDDNAFLRELPEKSRIILFANATCAYNCPARTCYAAFSQTNWGLEGKSTCSKALRPRPNIGYIFFDVNKFASMGFYHFKLVPNPSVQATNFLRSKSPNIATKEPLPDRAIRLYSFPKCGRTWLRFLLAHYFNLVFKLEVPMNLQTLFTLLPNDHAGLLGVEHFQFQHIPGLPLVVSSHKSNMKQPGILLLRSIPDVVISDYFQHQNLGMETGSIAEFIQAKSGSLYRYFAYLNFWAKGGKYEQQQVLTYENMNCDTATVLGEVLNFLGVPIEHELISEAVKLSSFELMQNTEKTIGHAGLPPAKDNNEMLKVRKGKVGGYVNYLSNDEIESLFKITDGLLLPEAKEMLCIYGIATGHTN